MSYSTVPPTSHPTWCDPRCCEDIKDDIHHAGTPQSWQTTDAYITITLRRTDEHDFPDQTVSTEIQFFVENRVLVSEGEQVYFSPSEARHLGCRLIAAAATAERVTR